MNRYLLPIMLAVFLAACTSGKTEFFRLAQAGEEAVPGTLKNQAVAAEQAHEDEEMHKAAQETAAKLKARAPHVVASLRGQAKVAKDPCSGSNLLAASSSPT